VFAPICALSSLLIFASTLTNGIRLVELPAAGDSVEIVAGYHSAGLASFASTAAAKALLLDAYAAGATLEFINDLDRTAIRIVTPKWALPMLTERLPALFREVPGDEGAAPSSPSNDFRSKVEEEVRNALLGPPHSARAYSTEDAFVLISGQPPASLREALAAIPKRASGNSPEDAQNRLVAERTLRFKSELPEGGVIFGAPLPGVYYKQWYQLLLLDKLIHRIVPLNLTSTLPLTVIPYYYRLELTVPTGQFPEPVEEKLLQELERLQFVRATASELTTARNDATSYLDSKPVRDWFASYDLAARRDEGVAWIQSMSADDLRVAARDLLIMNRVIASWAPRARQASVSAEPLNAVSSRPEAGKTLPVTRNSTPLDESRPLTTFPAHTHPAIATPLSERLGSGVSIAASTSFAVFVAGGPITKFDRELTPEDVKAFQQYRGEHILVLAPAESMDRMRQLWSVFKGTGSESGLPKGKVSGGDLPALFILKTILDLRLINAGSWRTASLRIDASEGSALQISATDEDRAQILDWIKSIANTALPESYFTWAREVAMHRFESVRPDLQALTWERDPQGTVQDLETITARHVQDVARIYF
jgi:hypothetical protein